MIIIEKNYALLKRYRKKIATRGWWKWAGLKDDADLKPKFCSSIFLNQAVDFMASFLVSS